ncbi:hypothetical protein B484DRAFT_178684, partial [Ochromonadaceae sp. CCMP2298]
GRGALLTRRGVSGRVLEAVEGGGAQWSHVLCVARLVLVATEALLACGGTEVAGSGLPLSAALSMQVLGSAAECRLALLGGLALVDAGGAVAVLLRFEAFAMQAMDLFSAVLSACDRPRAHIQAHSEAHAGADVHTYGLDAAEAEAQTGADAEDAEESLGVPLLELLSAKARSCLDAAESMRLDIASASASAPASTSVTIAPSATASTSANTAINADSHSRAFLRNLLQKLPAATSTPASSAGWLLASTQGSIYQNLGGLERTVQAQAHAARKRAHREKEEEGDGYREGGKRPRTGTGTVAKQLGGERDNGSDSGGSDSDGDSGSVSGKSQEGSASSSDTSDSDEEEVEEEEEGVDEGRNSGPKSSGVPSPAHTRARTSVSAPTRLPRPTPLPTKTQAPASARIPAPTRSPRPTPLPGAQGGGGPAPAKALTPSAGRKDYRAVKRRG